MKANGGFTLIELILVTVIIAILAGSVTLTFQGRAEEARVNRALGDIKQYESAIELFALDHNDAYPGSLNDLMTAKKTYVRELNTDPWGSPYVFVKPGKVHPKSYDIFSAGPDGVQGSADDVVPWKKEGDGAEE